MLYTFLQYKNIDICMDFICPSCASQSHVDGWCAYQVRCPYCDRVWKLGQEVRVTEGDPNEFFVSGKMNDEMGSTQDTEEDGSACGPDIPVKRCL